MTAKRKQYEKHLMAILSKGKKQGVWAIESPGITAKAILALLTGVSNWYRADGSLSQPRLTKLYQLMVERMLRNG
ncbi:hypothetical protein D3C85_1653280 [compost metagenome]